MRIALKDLSIVDELVKYEKRTLLVLAVGFGRHYCLQPENVRRLAEEVSTDIVPPSFSLDAED